MGFTSRDWSKDMESGNPTPEVLFEPGEVVLKEELHLRGPIPIPVSVDSDRSWPVTRPSVYLNPIIRHE